MKRPHARTERGATAITIAASLLLLMGFAAIAVDTGAAYSERRAQQGAVDAGLLSAAVTSQRLPVQAGCPGAGDFRTEAACNGAMVAIDNINTNLGTSFTEADFADTARCPDSVFPAEYADPGGTYTEGADAVIPQTTAGNSLVCIRYTPNLDKLRIVLPVTDVDTTFGQVLGRQTISVSALGEVEIQQRRGASVIPFIVGPTGAAQNVECLFEPATGLAFPPCDGPDDGNFGYMRPYLYGDDVKGTTATCSGGGVDRIAQSLAKGADHVYQLDSLVPGVNIDADECPNSAQEIDYVDVETGGSSNAITAGLFGTPGGTEGLLRCKDGDSDEPDWLDPNERLDSPHCIAVNATIISGGDTSDTWDNTPLWEYINPGANSEVIGGKCVPGGNAIKNKVEMEACLDGWRDWADGPDNIMGTGDDQTHTMSLFSRDIITSPRFAWVPITNIDPQSGGSGYYSITDFRPIYLQTIFLKCNANTCDIVFDPGEPSMGPCPSPMVNPQSCGWDANGNKSLDGMTAFIIRDDMLLPEIAEFPYRDDKLTYNLSE